MDHALEALAAERREVLKAQEVWQSLGVDAEGDARTPAVLQRLKVF